MPPNSGSSQEAFVLRWFEANPDRTISHLESKPAIEKAWLIETGTRLEDSDRAIRKLAAQGKLEKVGKGLYRFSSEELTTTEIVEFTEFTKQAVLERDGFRCTVCGEAPNHFLELHVVPILQAHSTGARSLSSGRTLCSRHKIANDLIGPGGDLSKAKLRQLLQEIRSGGKIQVSSLSAFVEELLEVIQANAKEPGVRWKDFD